MPDLDDPPADPLAVHVIQRTLLRHAGRLADPLDDYLARVIVWRLTTLLAAPPESLPRGGRAELARERG